MCEKCERRDVRSVCGVWEECERSVRELMCEKYVIVRVCEECEKCEK